MSALQSLAIPTHPPNPPPQWRVAALYTLSGTVGVAYEVLWVRMLSGEFSVSTFGVVITVAAFMAGMGLGCLLADAGIARITRPLLGFAAVETGVACYALLLPWLLARQEHGFALLAPGMSLATWYALQGLAALCLLLLPAMAVGSTFPLVLSALGRRDTSVGVLYGVNTAGAAVGALLPLALLPTLGWSLAVRTVAGLGLLVAAAALYLARGTRVERLPPTPAPAYAAIRASSLTLWAYAGVGVAALMLEVGWTRLFGMLLLRTEYVLAVILAVYLSGIGLGSLAARAGMTRRWWDWLPVLAALWTLLGLMATPLLAKWAEQAVYEGLATALFWQGIAIALCTLPVTLVLGAWLPLLSRISGTPGAWLAGVNALGAALGALLAGFVAIPLFGTPGTIAIAALLLCACGGAWAGRRSAWSWLVVLPLAVFGGSWLPVRELLPVTQAGVRDLYRYEDAVSITHVVERPDGQRLLLSDLQRMDASTDAEAVRAQMNQARLPLLLHPAPHNVLFLGLGTGISAAGSLPFPDLKRVAVELSAGAIISAPRYFSESNQNVMGALHVVRDDARRYLSRSVGNYDVIIGDLFHPDLVGRSTLLSVQQFRRAQARLAPGGLFVQWLAVNQFDVMSLGTVLRSFAAAFPHGMLFMDGFRLALVGARDRPPTVADIEANLQRMPPEQQQAATGEEGMWTWVGRYWGPLNMAPGPLQDEWAPRIEFALPALRYEDRSALPTVLAWLLARRPPVELAATQLQVPAAARGDFERAYVADELGMRAWLAELKDQVGEGQRLLRMAHDVNPQDRWIGCALADRMMANLSGALQHGLSRWDAMQRILAVCPDHAEALRALWHAARAAGRTAEAARYRQRFAMVSPLDRELR